MRAIKLENRTSGESAPATTSEASGHGWFWRLQALHGYPVKFILDAIGFMWGIYFLANHQWPEALVATVVPAIFGTLLARRENAEAIARTYLGKYCLLRTNPLNLIFQLAGFGVLAWGAWLSEARVELLGITLLLLGHCWGWTRHYGA